MSSEFDSGSGLASEVSSISREETKTELSLGDEGSGEPCVFLTERLGASAAVDSMSAGELEGGAPECSASNRGFPTIDPNTFPGRTI